MSYILGIDTSSGELGIGLADEVQGLLGVSRYMRNSHAEHISRTIEFLFATCAVKAAEIGFIAIAVGPGSFTGLRIGISFIKGFCFNREIKVLPVSSLESAALAWNNREKPIAVAFDARNGEVFWARFAPRGDALVRTHDDALTPISRFRECLEKDDIVITDTLGNTKSTAFDFLEEAQGSYPLEKFPVQRGLACARLAIRAKNNQSPWVTAAEIMPKYLSITTMEKKLAGLALTGNKV
jgi:tRNA threonylcarbamoyl adenosine modification protein YeaZ